MRAGDFSKLTIGGKAVTVKDPLTGQPFPGNTVPSSRFNATALKILDLYPKPNQGDPDVPVRNFLSDQELFGFITSFGLRVDHNLTSKQTLSFAWGRGRLPQYQDIAAGGTEGGVPHLYTSQSKQASDTPSLTWTYAMRATLVNEFRIGMLRHYTNSFAGPLGLSGRGLDWIKQMGIQGIDPGVDAQAMPRIFITEVNPFQGMGQGRTRRDFITFIDNLAWQRGKHSFKFGVTAHNFQRDSLSVTPAAYGTLNFTGRFTGVGFADFLLGVPDTTQVFSPRPLVAGRFKDLGFYFQDKWAITRNVTFSYGLRQELWTPPRDNRNLYFNFDPKSGALVVPNDQALKFVHPQWFTNVPVVTASQAGFPEKLRHISYVNFSPRLGLAWRPFGNDKTAVRMGYGIYHDPLTFDSFLPFATGSPFALDLTYQNQFDAATGQYLFALPRPVPTTVGARTAGVGAVSVQAISLTADKIPYVQQWNFTIDREIMRDTRLSVSYIGSKATQLMWRRNINVPAPSTTPFVCSTLANCRRPYPVFGSINLTENGGNQTYESLEVMLFRRFSGGLQFEGGWIWASAINDVEDAGTDLGPVTRNPFCRRCEKGRQTDVNTHSFKGTFVWEPPWGRGKRLLSNIPPALNAIIGGWVTSVAFDFRTGEFLTPVFTGRDISNTGITSGVPDRVCDGNISGPKNFRNKVGDLSCFAIPAAGIGRFGNSGRGIIVGPNNKFWDMGVYKEFPIGEKAKFRLGFSGQNIWRWISFGFHNTNISSPTGLEAGGAGKGVPSGRVFMLQGKLSF